jgi:hypothetical protein
MKKAQIETKRSLTPSELGLQVVAWRKLGYEIAHISQYEDPDGESRYHATACKDLEARK